MTISLPPRHSYSRRLSGQCQVEHSDKEKGWVGRELEGRDMLVGYEGEGSSSQHFLTEVAEDWACLGMQVSQHFIRPPAT